MSFRMSFVGLDGRESIISSRGRLGRLVGYVSYSAWGDTGLHEEGEEGEDHISFSAGSQGSRGAMTEGLAVAAAEVSTIRLSGAARESWESEGEQSSLSALRLRWLRGK